MNQKALVSDLARLEEMTTDTNLLIHIARIRNRAENGFYHLQAGTIRNPVTGSEYPVMRRRIGRTDLEGIGNKMGKTPNNHQMVEE